MKEVFKSKGMIAFSLLIISLSFLDIFKIKKVSDENTNNSNYLF